MRAKNALRLVGFIFLALLPTVFAKTCKRNRDCEPQCCMKPAGVCSDEDYQSVKGGIAVDDECECETKSWTSATKECRCNNDGHCKPKTCCITNTHICVEDDKFGGTLVEDPCQCKSGEVEPSTNLCTCEQNDHCASGCCVLKTKKCSLRQISQGGAADDKCECISGAINAKGKCECVGTAECKPGEICCPKDKMCGKPRKDDSTACGDPHMTGFRGQKFDFTGADAGWYALVSDPLSMHLNMRVSAPMSSVPGITYITGLSLLTTDVDEVDHSLVISVRHPHNLDSACPDGVYPCLADGSLSVLADGNEVLVAPGTVTLGPGVQVTAVNIPGECRSFGFETYWEKKKLEHAQSGRRLLSETLSIGEWILTDPTVTDMVECTTYVARAMSEEGAIFAHQSEHASFQIVTPTGTIRLSHGRLHQLAMRDPTDQFDLPDHLTWQMNMAIDHTDISEDAQGILGETFVPTLDDDGNIIMHGMECIRGAEADYAVAGPLGVTFAQGEHNF